MPTLITRTLARLTCIDFTLLAMILLSTHDLIHMTCTDGQARFLVPGIVEKKKDAATDVLICMT
jgi:hypothetical protein